MLAQYSKSTEDLLDDKAQANRVFWQTMFLAIIQGIFAFYLIYISTVKLRVYWAQQRADILHERKINSATVPTTYSGEYVCSI